MSGTRPALGPLNPIVVLSPHADDACFSLGHFLSTQPGVTLVTLYSRSDFLASGRGDAEHVTAVRRAEDLAFATRLQLKRHELGLLEAPLRGHEPFDLSGVDQDAQALDERLCPLLDEIAAACKPSPIALFCPLGVGNHRDHIATLLVALYNHAALNPRFRLRFYEDLPYAARLEARSAAIARLQTWAGSAVPRRHALRMNADQFAEKTRLIALYPSQRPPGAQTQSFSKTFSPADPQTPEPHEAWWELT